MNKSGGDFSEESLKMMSVELQKISQLRSEIQNTLIELELFTNKQPDFERLFINKYKIAAAEKLNRMESSFSVTTNAHETAPPEDLDARCFPISRRKVLEGSKPVIVSRDSLRAFKAFDV